MTQELQVSVRLRADGSVERIRRAETLDDYFATLRFEAAVWRH